MSRDLENINVVSFDTMPTPAEIHARLPLTALAERTVAAGREVVRAILDRRDPRLVVVVGPCSIHDPAATLEYAARLKALAAEVADVIYVVMRTYFEKPRTSVGWKGYINDPRRDDSFRVDEGMALARELLLAINELGLPCGTEALDPVSPQYLADLIAWYAVGARTTESQTHREMSSGLSAPVGFKNGTDGGLEVAINAMLSASSPHSFLGVNDQGRVAIVRTAGNKHAHLVLRGGGGRPNYDTVSIWLTEQALTRAGLPHNLVVDCSHANSMKRADLQPMVLADCVNQIRLGNRSIVGLMVESNLVGGCQPVAADLGALVYGQSITDACVDWPHTEQMLRDAAVHLRDVLPGRAGA